MNVKTLLLFLLAILILGLLIPQELTMPVVGAKKSDYNSRSFWYYPWGKSGTHKGVDIFAKKGNSISSSTSGLVLFAGQISMGGNVVFVLGPKWRIHYYAHLDKINISFLSFVNKDSAIGTVGTSGNAAGKPPHLHYEILTIIPYPWRIDFSPQGWQKMLHLNPIEYLEK